MASALAFDTSEERVLWKPRRAQIPRADVAGDLPRYREWVERRQADRLREAAARGPRLPAVPELEVVLVVHRTEPEPLRASLAALRAQVTARWHLSITMAGPPDVEVDAALGEELSAFPPGRLDVHRCPEGTSAAGAARVAVEASNAPCFTILVAGDRLAPDAVSLLAEALLDADVAYGDEDRVGGDGLLFAPALKPDWSPELSLTGNYVGRPVAYRRALAATAGGITPLAEGDWEHDLLLRVAERTDRIAHVPEVLCHRTGPPADPATGSGAVAAALARRGEAAHLSPGAVPGTWRVRRSAPSDVLVSIVIPFRDSTSFLRSCVDSLVATRGDTRIEIALVDNGSVEPETLTLLDRLDALDIVSVHHDPRPFNWAAINNRAAATTRGDILLFLNDDVEAQRPGWLDALIAQAHRPQIGAAGARLLYPTGQVQFAGTVLRLGGAAGHLMAGLPGERSGYLGMAQLTRDVAAVTGACMATRRSVFERLEGFDEQLGIDCNDVDYCLRARAAGLRIVYEPQAELFHYESPTRGASGSGGDIVRFIRRWEEQLLAGDPFLNANLTRRDGSAALREEGELERWWEWRKELERAS